MNEERLQELMKYKKADIIKMYARTLSHLQSIVEDLDLWKCKECGHWSMKDRICHNCSYDPTYEVKP